MAGLVLSRRKGQALVLEVPGGPTIRVTVTELHRSSVKLLFDAPGVVVARAELYEPLSPPEQWSIMHHPLCDGKPETCERRACQRLKRLALREDRSIEQQKTDGDYPNPYANNEGDE